MSEVEARKQNDEPQYSTSLKQMISDFEEQATTEMEAENKTKPLLSVGKTNEKKKPAKNRSKPAGKKKRKCSSNNSEQNDDDDEEMNDDEEDDSVESQGSDDESDVDDRKPRKACRQRKARRTSRPFQETFLFVQLSFTACCDVRVFDWKMYKLRNPDLHALFACLKQINQDDLYTWSGSKLAKTNDWYKV